MMEFARISYGPTTIIPVLPDDERLPLPAEFDFDNPLECARKVFQIMSLATGSFRLKGCQLRYIPGEFANLTAHGIHVYYRTAANKKLVDLTPDQIEERMNNTIHERLGDVIAIGKWMNASWTNIPVDRDSEMGIFADYQGPDNPNYKGE